MPRSKQPALRLAKSIDKPKFIPRRKVVRQEELLVDYTSGRTAFSIGPVVYDGPAVNWSDCPPELRALEASRATTLGPAICDRPDDAVIRDAFDAWTLDPSDPWHWRLLLFHLADTHFGRSGKRSKWTLDEHFKLLVRSEKYSGTDSEKVRRLREDYPEDYASIGDEGSLRRELRNARKRVS